MCRIKLKDQKLKNSIFYQGVIFIVSLVIATGCDKEPTSLGEEILPSESTINFQHSIISDIDASLFLPEDDIAKNTKYCLLGNYTDPTFGECKAEFITQLSMQSAFVNFFEEDDQNTDIDINIQSVTFYIDISGNYASSGDQTIEIWEMKYFPDTAYVSYVPDADSIVFIADGNISSDSSIVSFDLPIEFGQRLFDINNDEISIEDVQSEFKGLYFKASSGSAEGILYANLLSKNNYIGIEYYEVRTEYDDDQVVALKDSSLKTTKLITYENAIQYNLFQHDYTGTDIQAFIDGTDSVSDKIYLQAMNGIQATLDLSALLKWRDSSNIAITNAELKLKLADGFNTSYPEPDYLSLIITTDDGIIPMSLYSINYSYNGTINEATGEYNLTITDYVTDIIKGEREEVNLTLHPGSNFADASRVVLSAKEHENPISIEISYVKTN